MYSKQALLKIIAVIMARILAKMVLTLLQNAHKRIKHLSFYLSLNSKIALFVSDKFYLLLIARIFPKISESM
jgi:hypothetical protein